MYSRPPELEPSTPRRPLGIVMVAYTHYRTDSRVRREAEAFVSRGDRVTVIALRREREAPGECDVAGVTVRELYVPRYRGDSAAAYLKSYGRFFFAAFGELARRCWRARRSSRNAHDEPGVDLVWVHTMPDFMVFAAALPKSLGVPLVLDIHDLMPELYRQKWRLAESHPIIRLVTAQERASAAFADALVCVHEPHRQALAAHGIDAERLRVVMNVPDERVFFPRPQSREATLGGDDDDVDARKEGEVRLIYHGTVAERLGVDVAVEAFGVAAAEIPELTLHILGEGDGLPSVRQAISTLSADARRRVRLRDRFVPVDALPPILCRADIGLVPARLNEFTRHILPVKLMEYVALGLPSIASELPAVRAYFDDEDALLVPPGDRDALATAILRLARDPTGRAAMAAHARRFLDAHGFHRQRERLYEIADGLVLHGEPC